MRCMTAIWPAGPPKESAATFSQTRNASAKEGKVRGALAEVASSISCPRLVRRPAVGFVGGIAAPAVEGVVERHPRFELGEIVGIHAGKPEGGRQEPGRFRREIEAPGVGAAHDRGKAKQRLGAEANI